MAAKCRRDRGLLEQGQPKLAARHAWRHDEAAFVDTTTNEVVARLNGQWEEDVRAYDEVYSHILALSDALSDGIIKQFPASSAPEPAVRAGQ